MKISCVMPIHNEEKYLPYSLNSLLNAPIYEIVCVLDRCTDKSKEICRRFSVLAPFRVRIIEKNFSEWKNPASESFELGAMEATGHVIFSIGADCVFDPKIFQQKYWEDPNINALGYTYWHGQLYGSLLERIHCVYVNTLLRIFKHLPLWKKLSYGLTGFYGVRREIWNKVHLRDIPSEYMVHLREIANIIKTIRFIEKAPIQWDNTKEWLKYGYILIESDTIHLRAGLSKSRQLMSGIGQYYHRRFYPLWRVILQSIVYLKFHVFIGYWKTKMQHLGARWGYKGELEEYVRG